MYVMLYHYVYYMFMAIGSFAGRRVLFLKKWCADFPDRPPFLDRGKDRKHGEIYGTYENSHILILSRSLRVVIVI